MNPGSATTTKTTPPPTASAAKPAAEQPKAAPQTARVGTVEYALQAYAAQGDLVTSARFQALWSVFRTDPKSLSWGRDCQPADGARLLLFCLANGLDPNSNDVENMGGRPYITYAGRTKIAFKVPNVFQGFSVSRPATKEEREAIQAPADAVVWYIEAVRSDCKWPFANFGWAGGATEKNPVAKQWPFHMAIERASNRALRMCFPADVSASQAEVVDMKAEDVTVTTPPTPALPTTAETKRLDDAEKRVREDQQRADERKADEERQQAEQERASLIERWHTLVEKHADLTIDLFGETLPNVQGLDNTALAKACDEIEAAAKAEKGARS